MTEINVVLDGNPVKAEKGSTILEVARKAGIYIPALCAHPDLPSTPAIKSSPKIYQGDQCIEAAEEGKEWEGCGLCVVEIEEEKELQRACATEVAEGMVIFTHTPSLEEERREKLSALLAHHPHACLTCAQKEGCSREPCSTKVPVEERCCPKFGNCELEKIAYYIGIKEETPRWIPTKMPILEEEPLLRRDYNICIGCTRCVRICKDLIGVGALGFVHDGTQVKVGTIAPTLKESGCRFCTACVEVCPTGALLDKNGLEGKKEAFLVPCKNNCPLQIDVPSYVRLIREEKFEEAAALIQEKTPFAEVLGHICFHPCEKECRRGKINQPVSICALKRFVASYQNRAEQTFEPVGPSVAIVGAGPAGITAAYELVRLGYDVTMFDPNAKPGGMMQAGIPPYRLPREVLRREIDKILKQGIKFCPNITIGKDLTLEDLRNQGFKAIFLAAGAGISKKLEVAGGELAGVMGGLEFLQKVNRGEKVQLDGEVLVIGGGNVAMDAALTALRLGASQVKLICLESPNEMPAHPWEIEEAREEGVIFYHRWGIKEIEGDKGRIKGAVLMRCISIWDEKGNFNPSFDHSKTMFLPGQHLIWAIGQRPDFSFLKGVDQIKITPQGTIEVDPITFQTNLPWIFAGGELVTGPSSAVEAMASGKKAALAIDQYLEARKKEENSRTEQAPSPWLGKEEGFVDRGRVPPPCLPLKDRLHSFDEITRTYTPEMAVEEAKRCLQCDLRLRISSPPLPPEKWLKFNEENLEKVPPIEGVYQLLDEKRMVISIKGTPNLRQELEQQLGTNQKARYFIYEENPLYTKRESELIQQFLQKYGHLPEGGDELEDLF